MGPFVIFAVLSSVTIVLAPARAYAAPMTSPDLESPPMERRYRVVIAKPGLDGHDRGAKVIARALRDGGFEVIYTGLFQTPEQIAETTLQEDADAVGISVLSGAHMTLFPTIMALLAERGLDDVIVFGGGIIPEADIEPLREVGIARLFTPGTPLQTISDWLTAALDAREAQRAR
jgi:methylmalonyl-CoA mutase C-terminal domain/subunit